MSVNLRTQREGAKCQMPNPPRSAFFPRDKTWTFQHPRETKLAHPPLTQSRFNPTTTTPTIWINGGCDRLACMSNLRQPRCSRIMVRLPPRDPGSTRTRGFSAPIQTDRASFVYVPSESQGNAQSASGLSATLFNPCQPYGNQQGSLHGRALARPVMDRGRDMFGPQPLGLFQAQRIFSRP